MLQKLKRRLLKFSITPNIVSKKDLCKRLMGQTFLSKTFASLYNMKKQYEKMFGKIVMTRYYSLAIKVQGQYRLR